MHVLNDQPPTDVLSSPPTDLCDSLHGLSILAFDGFYRQAVLENANPVSPTGLLQSLEVDLCNGDFIWDSTRVISDIRSCCSGPPAPPGEQAFHFWRWGGWGVPPLETYSQHHTVSWLESDATELKDVRTCIYVLVRIVLAVIPLQSIQ